MILARCVDSRSDFLETTWEEWWEDIFSALSAAFCMARLSFVCLFGFSLFRRYSVLGSLNKETLTGNDNENNGCVSVSSNSLSISLPLFTKVQKTATWNSFKLHIWEKVNYTTALLKISLLNFEGVLRILFGIFLTVQTKWMNWNSREIRRMNVKSIIIDVVFGVVAVAA